MLEISVFWYNYNRCHSTKIPRGHPLKGRPERGGFSPKWTKKGSNGDVIAQTNGEGVIKNAILERMSIVNAPIMPSKYLTFVDVIEHIYQYTPNLGG